MYIVNCKACFNLRKPGIKLSVFPWPFAGEWIFEAIPITQMLEQTQHHKDLVRKALFFTGFFHATYASRHGGERVAFTEGKTVVCCGKKVSSRKIVLNAKN